MSRYLAWLHGRIPCVVLDPVAMTAWRGCLLSLRKPFLVLSITLLASYLWLSASSSHHIHGTKMYKAVKELIPGQLDDRDPADRAALVRSWIFQQRTQQQQPQQQQYLSAQHRRLHEELTHDSGNALEERRKQYQSIWQWAADAISAQELFPDVPEVDEVLRALEMARIVSVDVLDIGTYESGTTHKWVVMLEGGQKAMMKLVW